MTVLASAIYEGRVRHRRHAPRAHAFSYRMAQLYLDLDELDAAFRGRWLWSVGRRNLAAFHRRDFLGDPARPLADAPFVSPVDGAVIDSVKLHGDTILQAAQRACIGPAQSDRGHVSAGALDGHVERYHRGGWGGRSFGFFGSHGSVGKVKTQMPSAARVWARRSTPLITSIMLRGSSSISTWPLSESL